MDEHAPALPDDLLTYTEAAVLTGRGRAAPKEWVRERKVRCWHDVREGVLVALVSRAEVLRFVGGTDVRHRPATDNQRGGARRTRACLRILGRAEEFLMRVGSGDTLGVACRACGIPTATLRHWMRSESAKEDGEIAAFLARLKEARRSAARRRGADVKRPEGGNIRAGLGYFVGAESGDGAVKIGFTARDMDQRFRDLQTGSPVRLMVILTVMAPRAFEPWLHELMAEDRVHGEWFARTARLHALIDALRQHPDVRLTTPSELRRLVEVARSNPLFAPGSDAAA
ncbi:MAG: hypothetical protein Q8S13_09665 [Dehalococcoidia bacterium]|nr:hypothetical protein [Dehalococcoidia bacterium]